jgi:hypothetical protein
VGVCRRLPEQRLQQRRDEVGDLGQTVGDGAGVALGQDDQAVSRQRGQERLLQPSVDRAELLVAVDQQDGARQQVGGLAVASPSTEGGQDGQLEPLRGRVDLPCVDQHGGPAGVPRPAAELQQQGGLADPARAVHEQDPPRRPPSKGVVEAGQLAPTPDEGSAPGVVEKIAEVCRHLTTLQHSARPQRPWIGVLEYGTPAEPRPPR